jgi:transaldolase
VTIFLDSANLKEAKAAKDMGWVHGLTTNPVLLRQSGLPAAEALANLSALGFPCFFYQLTGSSVNDMEAEAETAHAIIGDALVLKVAPHVVGIRFLAFNSSKYSCCLTAVYSAAQAMVAQCSGARYVAVYVNRATRLLGDGISLTSEISAVLKGSEVKIVAASLKSPREAVAAHLAGAHDLTLPFAVLQDFARHPLSDQTIDEFSSSGIGLVP